MRFMEVELPKNINKVERGIINLENSSEEGNHWTAYYRNNVDSYGSAPPKQLFKYIGPVNLYYNDERFQNYDDPQICCHLCLTVLEKLAKGEDYEEVLKELRVFKFKEIHFYINGRRTAKQNYQ
jgi:hypothetical protein